MSCAGIGRDRLREYGDKGVRCVICAGTHEVESHKYEITTCMAKIEKICTQVIPKCANCGGNHQATAFECPAKLRAQTEAWNKKMENSHEVKTLPDPFDSSNNRPRSRQIDMDVNTDAINWAKSPEAESSGLSSVDDNLSEEAQDKCLMLVVQHNCGQGYESTIMALETALSIEVGIVILQELFIGIREISHRAFNFYWPQAERKEIRVMSAIQKELTSKIVVENRTDLINHPYVMLLEIRKRDLRSKKLGKKTRAVNFMLIGLEGDVCT